MRSGAGVSKAPSKLLTAISAPVRTRGRRRLLSAALVLAALTIAGDIYWSKTHAGVLTDKDTVVVAEFTNTTGEPIFDGTLRQGLAAQLEQSPFLKLVSDDNIAQTLGFMSKPKDSRLTDQLAREVRPWPQCSGVQNLTPTARLGWETLLVPTYRTTASTKPRPLPWKR